MTDHEDQHRHSPAATAWILRATGRAAWGVAGLTLLRSAVSITAVVFALVLKDVIDAATAGDERAFFAALAALAGILLAQMALQAIIRWLNELVLARAENALKRRVYQAILTRRYSALAAYHTGELHTRMTSDTAVVAQGMASILPNTVAMVVKICGAAAVLLALDVRFAAVFLVGGTALLFVTYAFRKVMKRLHKRVQEADGRVRSYLQETVGNLLVLRSYGGEAQAGRQAGERMEGHLAQRMRRNRFSNLSNVGFALVMNAGYLFGLVWCGLGILNGTITYGTLTAVLQLVGQIQTPFANMTSYVPKYYAMLASAERLMEIEELPGEDGAPRMTREQRDAAYARLERIELRGVAFAYPQASAGGAGVDAGADGVPAGRGARGAAGAGTGPTDAVDAGGSCAARPAVMDGFDAAICKGSFTAVTGRSGIGKSTLLKLLLAVYEPDAGAVELVDADGTRHAATPSSRALFAYVPQGNFLLSGTVRQAVAFLEEEPPDDERILQACRIACADFVEDLPQGLDTAIGESGAGLSEGQAQRLAIARALYCGAPVLLLDESTSALDADTEKRLLHNIRELTDKTVVIVTHRRAALDVCDQVLAFEPPDDEAAQTAANAQPASKEEPL